MTMPYIIKNRYFYLIIDNNLKIFIYICTMFIPITKRLTFFLVFTLFCFHISTSANHTVRERLLDFSIQFAQEEATSPNDVRELQHIKANNVSDDAAFNAMRLFGRELFIQGKPVDAFEYFKQALAIISEVDNPSHEGLIFKANCNLMLGVTSNEVGMHSLSMEYYLNGLKIAEKLEDNELLGNFYNNIGACYSRINDYAKAEPYFNKSLETNLKTGCKTKISTNYSNLSEVRMKAGDIDGAIDFALKAVQCLDEKKNPEDYYAIQAHLGFLYLQKMEFDMAYVWLSNAYKHQLKIESKANLFETCLMLMNLYAATGKTDSLDLYKEETASIVNEINNPALRIRFYEGVSRLFHSRGETEKAYEISQRLIALKDSVYKAENLARMERVHNIYEIEKKALAKEHAIEKWNPVVVFFTMGTVVLILAALLVWITIIRHRAQCVQREKDEATALLAQVREMRINEERQQKEKAELNLNEQQRRLTAITLEKIKTSQQIDEALTEARQVLLNIPSRDNNTKQKIKNVIAKLTGLANEANWDEFLHYFTMVHPDFYRRLDDKHPDLTSKDRKLCALIALGLPTKDIASITSREVRSVETSRNRLRKKLALPSDVNLEDYMHHLAIGAPGEYDLFETNS